MCQLNTNLIKANNELTKIQEKMLYLTEKRKSLGFNLGVEEYREMRSKFFALSHEYALITVNCEELTKEIKKEYELEMNDWYKGEMDYEIILEDILDIDGKNYLCWQIVSNEPNTGYYLNFIVKRNKADNNWMVSIQDSDGDNDIELHLIDIAVALQNKLWA